MKRMIKRLVFTLIIVLSLTQVNAQNSYPSLLWEISGNGTEEPSYLYGTMHVSSRIAFSLSDSFFVALKNADVVALESDPSKWMDEMEKADMFSRNYDSHSGEALAGDFYSKAFNIDVPDGKDYAEMIRFEPSIVNGLLYRFNGNQADFEEDTYLDLFIFQAGKKLKKEVINLEDFTEVQDLSEKATKEAQLEKDKANPFGYDQNPYEMIQDAYRKGNLNQLDSIMMLLNSEAYLKYMLFQRNEQMSSKMDSIISSGKSMFSGIGAAHLAGDKGVIEILRTKGYTLRPILKDFSDKSIKRRKKIDAASAKLDYAYQYPSDSIFRLQLPGKLYELPMTSGKQTYIHPEMIHGSNYSVVRLKSFNAITGSTPGHIMEEIDSLLFENIPGEIVKKKEIDINGNPGLDIINKTRRGDFQRYQIIALPSEVIFFKIKGSRKFATSKQADKFFESIEFLSPDRSAWQKFTSESNEFSVMLPTTVKKSSASSTNGFINLQVTDPVTGDLYAVQRSVLHDYKYIEEDKFELEYLIESTAEKSELKIDTIYELSSEKYPSCMAELTSKTGNKLYMQTVLKRGNYYLLLQVSNSGKVNKEFFDSFSLQRETYPEFTTYTDTLIKFKVNTIELPHNFAEANSYDHYYGNQSGELDNSHLPESESRIFFNEPTGEKIILDYYKYHKYRSEESEAEFWNKRFKTSWNDESLFRSDIDSGYVNSYPYRDFYYTDTASIKEIHTRVILKNSIKYSIYYLTDSLSESSAFVSTFLESFTPLDTVYTASFFDKKADVFFEDIWSADSVKVRQALSSISELNLRDEHTPKIIKLIEEFSNEDFTLNEKAYLIEELGFLDHPNILPYMKKKYVNVADTATYQIGILKALGNQQTVAASELFRELVLFETPLSKKRDIAPIFFEFKDSLELAQHLFPEILELSALDEYQESIYQLTARLKDKGLIAPKDYASKLKEIKWEARNSVKRILAYEEDDVEEGYSNYLSQDYLHGSYYYKPNEYNRKFYNDPLSVYVSLLEPYKADPRVKSFFSKLPKIKDENQNFSVKSMELVLNGSLPNEDINMLCESRKIRNSLFELSAHFDMNLDSTCMNQESLAESILFKTAVSGDSVQFIQKEKITVKNKTGYVYFFKSLNSYNEEWQISFYGHFPSDTSDLNIHEELRGTKIKLRGSSEEEKINEIVDDFRLHGRQRADKKSSGGFNDYYLYD